ncbi:bifunctional epoxide hydrolase 2 isoform X2 [Diceros bicornis minor]|uniref:bifunctional epoxide hydrolase 2 isoform X2 n=1 Tax=Diceros bicornis minor TaxID=77932 RepID=UPI0026EF5100|nr:bifunctional epoxide hydrolase 2 isoform X2 [Diceros bicornis minor]
MALRPVVFDLYGVLALPSVPRAFARAEEELALPRGFLNEVLKLEAPGGSVACLLRGEITFSQWVPFIEEDCRKRSKNSGIHLPEKFSINQIFAKAISERNINHPMLQAALALRKKGFTTCLLTNNWLDDSPQRGSMAQLLCELRPHFDFLIESCRIGMAKPEPQIYKYVLDTLKASPNELLKTAAPLPTPCNPNDVSHGYVPIKPGVHLHFVELGSGPAVCLCHGFPESWFSWRYQIPALAQAGFRVLAVDMKGYGDSSTPPEIEEYSMEVICKDMVTFLDKLGISQAVFIGHDWGGSLVWNMALFYPERVRAVASLNTPFMPADPNVSPKDFIKVNPVFDYQLYFQEPGVAEAELEQNLSRTFKCIFRRSDEGFISTSRVCEAGGILVRSPEEPTLSSILTEEDLQFYVQQFKKSGFRGPLNWYRNLEKNWQWGCKVWGRKILIPALMVTAEKDIVLVPEMSKNMEDWIPHLKRGHIKDCGHWTQMEKPTELNQILLEWLETDAKDPPVVLTL